MIAESKALVKGNLIRDNQDTITLLGNEAQSEFAHFTKMMTSIITQNNSDVDAVIQKVIDEMKAIEADDKTSFLKELFQNKIKNLEESINKYQKALDYMNAMVLQLNLQKAQILKQEKVLLEIEERIRYTLQRFDESLEEGNRFLEQPKREKKEITALNMPLEIDDWSIRLKRKLDDLRTTQAVARQSKVQLEFMMNNNKELLDHISTLVLDVVPVWKKQMSTFIKIQNLKKIQIQKRQSIEKTNQEIKILNKEIENQNYSRINANAFDSIQELAGLEKEESHIKGELKDILTSL